MLLAHAGLFIIVYAELNSMRQSFVILINNELINDWPYELFEFGARALFKLKIQ